MKKIEALDRRAFAFEVDAADPAAVAEGVNRAVDQLGGLDVLVNNAGIGATGLITDLTPDDIDRVLAVNVRGMFAAARAAVARLSDGGRLIHIGSAVAVRVPGPGMTLYAMSKAALVGLSKGLARELGARDITSNVIQPGAIDTDMNPADGPFAEPQIAGLTIGRFGTTAEIAAAVVYLSGPQSAYLTGTELTVDGGHTA